jgi:hypothetical protein
MLTAPSPDPKGVERDHLMGYLPPVDRLDSASSTTRRAPPAIDRTPRPVSAAPRHEQLPGSFGARVVPPAGPVDDEQRLQEVVVPVRRIVRAREGRVDRLSGTPGEHKLVFEQKLTGRQDGFPACAVTRRAGVLVQTPQGR